jgi:primosomal protein N' (replication factor Y)
VCHYCGRARPAVETCPECLEGKINYRGTGTEKIEESIRELFPEARIARMDTDVTTKKGYHERVFKEFREQKLDILVGTQMIAKGLDFPNVTTVGVISADVSLNLPDFRSAERTFQLLTQVSGRTGRGAKGGIVVVQTFRPDDFSITCAAGHDYLTFAKQELEKRRELGYPPFGDLARVTFSGTKLQQVKDAASDLRECLRKHQADDAFQLLGPAECPLAQIKGRHRWHIVLKSRNREKMHAGLRRALHAFRPPASVQVAVDIDPLSML